MPQQLLGRPESTAMPRYTSWSKTALASRNARVRRHGGNHLVREAWGTRRSPLSRPATEGAPIKGGGRSAGFADWPTTKSGPLRWRKLLKPRRAPRRSFKSRACRLDSGSLPPAGKVRQLAGRSLRPKPRQWPRQRASRVCRGRGRGPHHPQNKTQIRPPHVLQLPRPNQRRSQSPPADYDHPQPRPQPKLRPRPALPTGAVQGAGPAEEALRPLRGFGGVAVDPIWIDCYMESGRLPPR